MSEPKALKPFPNFASDAEAEAFVDEADLTEYDFSEFRPTRFNSLEETSETNVRVPMTLLKALKDVAEAKGIPYTHYIREVLERDIAAFRR